MTIRSDYQKIRFECTQFDWDFDLKFVAIRFEIGMNHRSQCRARLNTENVEILLFRMQHNVH